MTTITLNAIELDTTIQCRADIDIATVNEYAEAMREGAEFPPVELFGTDAKCWIGDGWHRVMAARSIGLKEIAATLLPGSRLDALKFALSANAFHGRRRTTPDKQCGVAIALREFGKLSDVELGRMCAVTDKMVAAMRHRLEGASEIPRLDTRLGRDGKQYPAHPAPTPESSPLDGHHRLDAISHHESEVAIDPLPKVGPPRRGLMFARLAIARLEEIPGNDLERKEGLRLVEDWIHEHR